MPDPDNPRSFLLVNRGSLLWLVAAALVLPLAGTARAERVSAVVIGYTDPRLDAVVDRIHVELESAGHDRVVVTREAATCTGPAGSSNVRKGEPCILLRLRGDGVVLAQVFAELRPNQVTVVTAHGQLDNQADLAIVVTEALHGLLAAPKEQGTAQHRSPAVALPSTDANSEREATSVLSSLAAEPRLVLDIPTGGFWIGASLSFQHPLTRRLGFRTEGFATFRPVTYSDSQIDLESHLIWARWGVFGARSVGPFRIGWGVAVGAFANRATAETRSPWVGGSDGAFGAIFYAGSMMEFPARGRVFLRVSVGASTLVPRLRYQMAAAATAAVGGLLLESGLGLGLRLNR